MKLLIILLSTILLLPIAIAMNPPSLDTYELDTSSSKVSPSPDTYDAIVREVDREDRFERCVSRLKRDFPDSNKDFEGACTRIFASLDAEDDAVETLKKEYDLSTDQAERISKIKSDRRKKLEALNKARLEKLSNLEVSNIDRISYLSKERIEKVTELDQRLLERFGKLSRTRIKELSGKSIDEIDDELGRARELRVKPENAGMKRSVSEDKMKSSKKSFDNAKSEYTKAKENYQKSKEEFSELVAIEKEVCTSSSEECDSAREKTVEKAIEYLTELANQQLAYLDQLKFVVEGSNGFSENEANDILDEINAHEARINRVLEFLQTAETKAEVKDAGKSLITTVKHIHIKLEDRREQIVYQEGQKYVHRLEALEIKMDRMLASLEDSGVDTSEYESEVERISELISEANDKLSEGRQLFVEFRNSDNPSDNRELLISAREKFSEAHSMIIKANTAFNELKQLIWEETEREFEEEEDKVDIVILSNSKLPDPHSYDDYEVKT